MFRTIDQLFKKTSNKRSKPNFITYDITSQEKQLSKTVKPMSKIISITLAVILIVAILATAIYLLRSCRDDDNSNECGVCDGVGLVPNKGLGMSTCPYCKGAGIPPQ